MANKQDPARRPWVVALVGGPCSGKSTFARWLENIKNGVVCVVLHEAATAILTEYGSKLPDHWFDDVEILQAFQRHITARQLFDLKVGLANARARGIDLVVADRGVLDGAAYGGHSADHLVNISHAELTALYDQVIFFAPPPRKVWDAECANNPTRREDYEEMRALSKRLRECWEHHPNFVEVDGATWEEKQGTALAALLAH